MNNNHDHEPIPMSDFELGERYGSEDMYADMGIRPGARVAVEIGGVLYTDTIQGITSTDATLTWWQRLRRQLTPARWRKPVKPIWPAQPASITLEIGETDEEGRDRIERADHTRPFNHPGLKELAEHLAETLAMQEAEGWHTFSMDIKTTPNGETVWVDNLSLTQNSREV
ncbi:hypothetical protein [Mycobacterium intracellulare]|uniref:hypothetical protein n=1 Tax=Mycobacterium intracellulare TaxID=1767 RepID=UPI00080BE4EE|nr:hypothetical protein [Mycobacterium intracellulare]OCB15100.1 hypothetical protein A5689_26970 [Mycobacterium intracellulare subsp. yongonense]